MECRLSAPFGTVEKPVEVPSIYEERIVGVPDPDDDCIITWGIIREGAVLLPPYAREKEKDVL